MSQRFVVVVCRGNIGRSPFTEAVLNDELTKRKLNERIRVISRGVQGTIVDPEPVKFSNITRYPDMYKGAKPVLDELGIDLSVHVSTPISEADAKAADILLAVDNKTRENLATLFPDQVQKIHLISELVNESQDIVDPEGVSGADKQRQIFTDLRGYDQVSRKHWLISSAGAMKTLKQWRRMSMPIPSSCGLAQQTIACRHGRFVP